MSLKIYTIINCFIFSLILLIFSLILSILICIIQFDFRFWFLYLIQIISHIFEPYNFICISFFFVLYILITYYLKKSRNIIFTIFSGLVFGLILNEYEVRSLFVYKSYPLTQYFYTYLIAYCITLLIWYMILKKVWKNMYI